MAKAKKVSRNSRVRRAPVVNPNRRSGLGGLSKEAARDEKVLPLIAKLASAEPKERAMAASAIATLIEEPTMRQLLLKEKLVHTIMDQSLSDSSEEVVMEAFGILRNLAIEEGYDICVFLWRRDVLTAMAAWLEKVKGRLDNFSALGADQKSLTFDLAEHLISLAENLGTCSDDIMDSVLDRLPGLVEFALKLLSTLFVPASTKAVAAEALYALSEANGAVLGQIQAAQFATDDDQRPLVKVYLSGVEYNMYEAKVASIDLLDVVRPVVAVVKSIDVGASLAQLRAAADAPEAAPSADTAAARDAVSAVMVALELLTSVAESVVAGAAKTAPPPAEDDMDDDEAEPVPDMDVDEDPAVADLSESPVAELLVADVIPAVNTLVGHADLRSRALNCLNNLAWTLNTVCATAPQWLAYAEALWTSCAGLLKDAADVEIQTACVGIMWAAAKSFGGAVPVELDDVRWLTTLLHNAAGDDTLELRVRIVGLLGVLGMRQGRLEITKEVSVLLFTLAALVPKTEPAVAIEALNALFDVFGDQAYDYDAELFVRGGMLKRLTDVQPQIKQMAKKIDKRKNLELRTKADEVAINLQRFIAYKRDEQKTKPRK
ncbi:armadillo-type protein [Dipodascopsis tothii]|uniref:armadillo-type protein n=1 Tax=Dipodascopsis tothii TaxID=44089 RepID=UPI0034CE3DAF